ncbi:MAG: carbohydrate ABC transporter permease [Anaerolineae bacterium]|nr:carbohydrate ABC transporter permease [Anaerolineae bacterium]
MAESAPPTPPALANVRIPAYRSSWRMTPARFLAWLMLLALAVLWITPFLWMLSTSLKTPFDLFGTNWIPNPIAWENYIDAFSFGMWSRWATNTIVITVISMTGFVLSSSLVAYSFARLRWFGRETVFKLVLATMMLPGVVTMIPQFILFARLPAFGLQGSRVWVNTFLPLTVPAFTGSAFYIFLLRQFMRGIPKDLTEAARIDGASELRVWWNVILPLTKPALAAIAIFAFQGAWQDFMGPLIYLQSERLYTLQLGLRQYEFAFGGSPAWNWLMAASLIVMLPVLTVFVLFQRYFIEGVTLTGMKG